MCSRSGIESISASMSSRVPPKRPGRDLAVQHLRGDVGVVGRDLAPALRAVLGGDPHEADELVAERLDALDLHAAACMHQQS